MLWSGYTDSVKASPLVLRPPGALKEEDFLQPASSVDYVQRHV